MSIYALISGGAVTELFTPPGSLTIAECFNAAMVWIDVSAVTPAPQLGDLATETGGSWSFAAPTVPTPTAAEIAAAAYASFVGGGLTVTSTATPALSGVYAIDAQSETDIATEAQFLSTFGEFTTGATTNLPWPMPNGSVTVFPTTASFLSFAKAAGQAVAAAKLALAESAAMPDASAAIP